MEVLRLQLGHGVSGAREVSGCWGPVELAALEPGAHTVLGVGPLGKVEVPGSNRLVMAGWTPGWRGFYVSTLGSAGAALRACGDGIDAIVLQGRCETPSALVLSPGRAPRLFPVALPDAWIARDGGKQGTHALLRHVADRSGVASPRVLGIGPGAVGTTFGGVASATIAGAAGGALVLETWAGRGGFGSKWIAGHGLVAIVLDAPKDAGYLARPPAHDAVPGHAALAESLRKYRYHPTLKAGGTLGANLAGLRDRLLAFNHLSMEWPRAVREEIHERLVEGHYLRQHRDDGDGGRKGTDCGETCPAQCRRVASGQKKDFQPFAALGPSIGVFDQRAAELVYAVVEEAGVDAVDAGALAGWWMERIAAGVVSPREAGTGSSSTPVMRPEGFDPVADSWSNATIAASILRRALFPRDGALPLHLADATAGDADRALVVVNSAGGGVAPTQYWAPGVIAPTPIVGKYYTDYSLDFVPPRELGRRCGERVVAEIALDNLGLCRFQRDWAEDALDELLAASARGEAPAAETVDARHRALAARIAMDAPVALWRGARLRDIVVTWVREAAEDDPSDGALNRLRDEMIADPRGATRRFHRELADGIADAWRDVMETTRPGVRG